MKNEKPSYIKSMLNIGIGGVAGVGVITLVYPIETVKTIMQIRSEAGQPMTMLQIVKERMKTDGIKTFYKGIPAAIIRQFFFASIRLGLFFNAADYIKNKHKKNTLSIMESTVSSLGAAGIAISTVMPLDVVYVRFQAENALPANQRRGYTGLGNALSRIVKEEGLKTLWRGWLPAMARAMALNFGMLVPYDKCKGFLSKYLGYTQYNYILSSAIAGLGATVCCLPFDNAKVKLQKMKAGPDNKLPYKGLFDCMVKSIKKEGISKLWSGFVPFYAFCAPATVIALILIDGLRILLGVTNK